MQEKQENLDTEQLNRLWQHAMHTQNRFDNRMNFFLIFESLLLGVVTSLYGKSSSTTPVLVTVVCLGFLLTVLWGYVQLRERFKIETLRTRLLETSPEYREPFKRRQKAKWPVGSTRLLAYGVPILIAGVWLVLLIYALLIR